MIKHLWLSVVFVILCCVQHSFSKRPNIVFILADDYGFNDIGYHNSEIKTPTLDSLASEGVILENYYVQPICTPTRSQLLSGRYQIHTGLQHNIIWPPQANCLPTNVPTIADKLRQIGYGTHVVGKWHLGFYKYECTPTSRGFDTFYGFLSGGEDYYSHVHGWEGFVNGFDLDSQEGESLTMHWEDQGNYSALLFADHAQKVIEQHANSEDDKPMFLYMPFQSVHSPLQVPDEYVEQYSHIKDHNRRIYSGMVTCMDEAIKNITDTLKKTGMWEDTVLIFSTDNGGEIREGGNNWPLRGWKHSLWEGGTHGVGFVSGPLVKERQGKVSHDLIHVSDWFPTMLSLAGGSAEGLHLDGFDQWETISQGKACPREEILHNIDPLTDPKGKRLFNNTFDNRVRAAIRVGDWKLITGDPGNSSWIPLPASDTLYFSPAVSVSDTKQNLWLFNIKDDPNEHHDLSAKHTDIVLKLLDRLAYYNSTAVPVRYPPYDPRANPAYHGGVWLPWGDD